MTTRTRRRRAATARHGRASADAPDATTEPDPGPPPEAVFDRITGPYARRATRAMPGACESEET